MSSPSPSATAQNSSSDMSQQQHVLPTKDEYREHRLSFRKFAEYQMRREFKDIAIDKCRDHIKDFAQCAQEKGLMVVWSCRGFNKKMNECMFQYNSDEAWERYKEEHMDELEKRIIRSKD